MRKLVTLCILLLGALAVKAQIPAAAYSFSAASKTFTYITGSTPVTFGGNCDDGATKDINLGFTFTFCGATYTQISAAANGFICFSNSGGSTTGNSNTSGIEPAAFPLWDDISGCNTANSVGSFVTTGVSGSKVFTFEWKGWSWSYNTSSSAGNVISFQVKLYEATGRIEFLYDQGPDGLWNGGSASIGIIKSSTDYQALSTTGTSPGPSTTSFNTSLSTKPATGQSYMWDPPPPCPQVTPITMVGYNSQAASWKWTAASGGVGYEYAIDVSPTREPATTTTVGSTTTVLTASATGLTAATKYYIHVRSKCSQYSFSKWDTLSFTTLPPCSKPGRIVTSYIDSSSIKFSWPGVAAAQTYQYFIDSTATAPATANGATTSTTGFIDLKNLKEGKVYYVKYRSLCAAKDSSAWAIDSFRIPVPCRRPVLETLNLTSNRIIVNWKAINTAVTYEYFLGEPSSSTTPAFGTPVRQTVLQLPVVPMTEYNLYVRCSCSYYGISTVSAWGLLDFTSLAPLEINSLSAENELSAYPNPVKDILHINIKGAIGNNATIAVVDITGRVIKTTPVSSSIAIDLHDVSSGNYFVKYMDGNIAKTIKVTKE